MSEIADILLRIVEQRRRQVAVTAKPLTRPTGAEVAIDDPSSPGESFLNALRSAPGRAVIAEVKMGSPRLGSLVERVDPLRQARLYAANGAVAMSVVVEPDFFHGSYDLLSRCREAAGLPVLAKDFIVDPIQILWARQAGASAVLLIAALHEAEELAELAGLAREQGLVPLVECHSMTDLRKVAQGEWELVGINNRDLRTFEVDLERSMSLLQELPRSAVKVAESGIRSAADVCRLAAAGFDAFLIGESLLQAEDPAASLRRMVGMESDG